MDGVLVGVVQKRPRRMSLVLDRAKSRASRRAGSPTSGYAEVMLFGNADVDRDNTLTADEYRAHVVASRGEKAQSVVFDALLKRTDINLDGEIDFNEWLIAQSRHAHPEEHLRRSRASFR